MNYLSHPNKLLLTHIENILEHDREDVVFCEAVTFHDLGKVCDDFQNYIQKKSQKAKPHAFVSALIYLLNATEDLDLSHQKEKFFIFNTILSHHIKLKSFDNDFDNNILHLFKSELPLLQIKDIYSKKDVVQYFNLKEIEIKNFPKLRRKNRDLTFSVDDFITQKLLFSKLIFADKYEAIFEKSFVSKKLDYFISELYKLDT